MREEVIKSIFENRIVAIIRGVDSEKCLDVAGALYDGGIRLMELTYDQKNPETWADTANTIGKLVEAFAGKMHFGAGTVTNTRLVEMTADVGGQLIISPNVNKSVIEKTREMNMVSIPGAMTPTEILDAYEYGADFVKLFPASDLGINYVKSIKAPISHVPLLATGGITLDNAKSFVDAGCDGLCIGGALADKNAIRNGEFFRLIKAAEDIIQSIS